MSRVDFNVGQILNSLDGLNVHFHKILVNKLNIMYNFSTGKF